MWLFVLSLLLFHVYLMCRGLTTREFRLIHAATAVGEKKISGSTITAVSTGSDPFREKRRRPIYLTESGSNLLAYDQIYLNIWYMLHPRQQSLSLSVVDGNSDGRRVADMIDGQRREAYCYDLRDIAKLKLAREKRLKK